MGGEASTRRSRALHAAGPVHAMACSRQAAGGFLLLLLVDDLNQAPHDTASLRSCSCFFFSCSSSLSPSHSNLRSTLVPTSATSGQVI